MPRSGTVDPFHLGTDLAADWRKQFRWAGRVWGCGWAAARCKDTAASRGSRITPSQHSHDGPHPPTHPATPPHHCCRSPNQRLRARVLFVDPATKRVGLSLHRHLLAFSLPPNFPALGQVFEAAVVRRVDPGLGLMLELPAAAAGEGGEGAAAPGLPLTPGYAHISAVADKKVDDLTQVGGAGARCLWPCGPALLSAPRTAGWLQPRAVCAFPACWEPAPTRIPSRTTRRHIRLCSRPLTRPQFRPGQRHRARVLGFRPMDGLAVLTLKPSAVDQQVVSAAGEVGGGWWCVPACSASSTAGMRRLAAGRHAGLLCSAPPHPPPARTACPSAACVQTCGRARR